MGGGALGGEARGERSALAALADDRNPRRPSWHRSLPLGPPRLQAVDLTAPAAPLPLLSHLLPILRRGVSDPRDLGRHLAHDLAPPPLPAVFEGGIRSGPAPPIGEMLLETLI